MAKTLIDAARLRELLSYDPETGVFTRKVWRGGTSRAGTVAGSNHGRGHLQASIDGRLYFLHRLAWLYVHGEWPRYVIDHLNGNPSDNRITNLRDVPQAFNCQNKRVTRVRKTPQLRGVKAHGLRFTANISVNNRPRYLGTFNTPEEAHSAFLEAKKQFHPGAV
jgi:HNH endonuclease